ncbi:MAG: ATP-binding protein, partial [Myxococcales bacterium]
RVSKSTLGADVPPDNDLTTWEDDGDEMIERSLSFVHESDGLQVSLTEDSESDGTRRLLDLLPILYAASKAGEQIFLIDEIDRSLHTSLTRYVIDDFLRTASASPSGHDQLIFTTHDTNLLNGRLLHPASIWFVEKDRAGASHLHSLAEYDPAQLTVLTEHLEDGYLQGRFGAIPFLAPRDLDWRPVARGEDKAS